MKQFKQIISMFLVIVMVMSLLPLSVIAEDIHNTHTVQFKLNYNGAHKIPSQKVADGECAVQPEDVTREGWIFEYWYVKTDDNGIQKFDLSQPVTEDVTLYARWDEDIEYWGPIWNRNIFGAIENSKDDEEVTDIALPQTVFTHEGGEDNPNLVVDPTEKVLYYNNMLIVVLTHAVSDDIKVAVAKSVSGTIVGQIDGAFQVLQIMISETDYSSINDLCAKLMTNENVLYATYDTYIETEQASIIDNNPWSTNGTISDKGNENNPSGNDWWAEAIGAYTAWRYSDYAEEVVIGQIDSGFDLNHEDLKEKITLLEGYETNNVLVINDKGEKEINHHGTMVAGITVAKNNGIGLRGVADFARIVGIDDSPELIGTFNSIQFMDAISAMLYDGIKIINLEAYYPLYSEKKYKIRNKEEKNKFDSYGEYIEAHLTNKAYYSAKLIMAALCNAKNNGYEDFICIQAAGNGYDNMEGTDGIDTKYSGFFASINRESYEQFVEVRSDNSQSIPDYSFFDDRIIIVSGVENSRDSYGNYYIKQLNYGIDVDICACSYDIFSANVYDAYNLDTCGGTSSAAPMVAGAVAFVWGINPELSAPKVRAIVLNNYTYKAIGKNESNGWEYPMLNVGAAVKTVFDELYPNNITLLGKIKDKSNDKELSDIWVTYCNKNDEVVYRTRTDISGSINDVILSDLSEFIVHIECHGYKSVTLPNLQSINGIASFGTIKMEPLKDDISVKFKVIDSITNDEIPMVTVDMYKYNEHITQYYSGSNDIEFSLDFTGEYKIVLSANGYKDETINNVPINGGINDLGSFVMEKEGKTYDFTITHTYNNVTTDILAASPIEVYNGNATMTWTINSPSVWTVTKSGDWFSIDKTSGTAGETKLKISINTYTTTINTGTVEFTVDGKKYVAQIYQQSENMVAYGKCGDNLDWVLNKSGTLTISGTGDMWGFQEGYEVNANNGAANNQEWYSYKNDIVKVIIKSGVDSIGQFAFAYHSNLETVEIEDGLKVIDSWAFLRCTKLKNINIPNTVTFLGGKLFSYCALTEIYIPESVTFLGSWTFESDGTLKDIYFYGDRPHQLGAESFRNAQGVILHYVEGKERWTGSQLTIGSYSFPTETWTPSSSYKYNEIIQKGDFEFLIDDGEATLIWYSGSDEEVNIPATVNGYDVVGIAAVAFGNNSSHGSGRTDITSIIVPNNVRAIYKCAIDDVVNLESIYLPKTLISMGEYAIHNNESLRSVYFYGDFPDVHGRGMIYTVDTPPTLYYISGKAGWTSHTWTAPDGKVYNTATWEPENTN